MEKISHSLAKNIISQERLCTWPRFESEGFWNSEVAYSPLHIRQKIEGTWAQLTFAKASGTVTRNMGKIGQ